MRALALSLSVALSVSLLGACSEKDEAAVAMPEVFVVTVREHDYWPSHQFNARIASRSDVEISAQVTGELLAIHFTEGDLVKQGAPLFDIDPAPYEAALARAEAELAKSLAQRHNATRNFARGKNLVADGYISASEFDTLEERKLESIAQVAAARAAVDSAQVDLDLTRIKAPQDGRIGRSRPAVGDVVNPQYGGLTSLVGKDDMDVVFQIPESLVLLMAETRDVRGETLQDVVVRVAFRGGREYPHTGRIDYLSNRIDPATATIEARSAIPNPDDVLRPGMFVFAIAGPRNPRQGLMVPQGAVQVDQQGSYVLAVEDDDTVSRRNIVTGTRHGENVLVKEGLVAGVRLIMRGVQQARPGDTVKVSIFEPATEASEGRASDQ